MLKPSIRSSRKFSFDIVVKLLWARRVGVSFVSPVAKYADGATATEQKQELFALPYEVACDPLALGDIDYRMSLAKKLCKLQS